MHLPAMLPVKTPPSLRPSPSNHRSTRLPKTEPAHIRIKASIDRNSFDTRIPLFFGRCPFNAFAPTMMDSDRDRDLYACHR